MQISESTYFVIFYFLILFVWKHGDYSFQSNRENSIEKVQTILPYLSSRRSLFCAFDFKHI